MPASWTGTDADEGSLTRIPPLVPYPPLPIRRTTWLAASPHNVIHRFSKTRTLCGADIVQPDWRIFKATADLVTCKRRGCMK